MGFIIVFIKESLMDFIFSKKGLMFILKILAKIEEYWYKIDAKYNHPKGFKKVALIFGLCFFWIFRLFFVPIKLFGKGIWLLLRKGLKKRQKTK